MAMAWQRNLATTTSNLENYNNNSNKKKNCITQDTHTFKGEGVCVCVWGGGGGYVGKRWVSFMNFIVDKIIFLLSELFMNGSPYKYSCN